MAEGGGNKKSGPTRLGGMVGERRVSPLSAIQKCATPANGCVRVEIFFGFSSSVWAVAACADADDERYRGVTDTTSFMNGL